MLLINFQRIVRRLFKFNEKTKFNQEGYNPNMKNVIEKDKSFLKESLNKTGLDDKSYVTVEDNNNKDGFRLKKFKDGSIYKGYLIDNKANNEGILQYLDGDTFQGEFKSDKKIGFGIYSHINGTTYEGEWLDDIQNGIGIEIWTDKSEYKGDYLKGKKTGIGSYQWADGSSYEGEWFDNSFHGYVSLLLRENIALLIREFI